MQSKIMVDVDEQGLAIISISGFSEGYFSDVRDKLVKKFLEGGMFGLITPCSSGAEIHSMNGLDVLDNIGQIYGSIFKDNDSEEYVEFEQALLKLSSIIEGISGERSSAFIKKAMAQKLV